jgi:hypothetical protein
LRVAPTALLMAVIVFMAVQEFRKSQVESDPNDPYGRLQVVPRQHIDTRLA